VTPAEDEALDYLAGVITHDRCGVEPREDCRVRDWLVNAVRERVWFSDRTYAVGIAERGVELT
jgi:hypothetical protein